MGLALLIGFEVAQSFAQLTTAVMLPVSSPGIQSVYSSSSVYSLDNDNLKPLKSAPVVQPVQRKNQLSHLEKSNFQLMDEDFLDTLLELRAGARFDDLIAIFFYILLSYRFNKSLISVDGFVFPQNNPAWRVVPFLDPLGYWTGSTTNDPYPYARQRSYD